MHIVFMRLKILQPFHKRIVIGQSMGIPVPKTRAVKSAAIVVDGSCTIDVLIVPIAIHISHRHTVVALSSIGAVARRIAVESPHPLQGLATVPFISGHTYTCIYSTLKDQKRSVLHSIKHATFQRTGTVPAIVSPGGPVLTHRSQLRPVFRRRQLSTGESVKHRNKL